MSADSMAGEWSPDLQFLMQVNTAEELGAFERLSAAGLTNILPTTRSEAIYSHLSAAVMDRDGLLADGDVVAVAGSQGFLHVLYREEDRHHTVFVTNRCNSNCIMCSQPPTKHDDSWLIHEGIQVGRHIRKPPDVIGVSGGEPLLAGADLRILLDELLTRHPHCQVEVLTNGRGFADPHLARTILEDLPARVSWMVPLYGHADFLHDFVVQSPGAFDQTISGLLELQSRRQLVQLRLVLVREVLAELDELCEFICKNLPFVADVALMGCEPTGFALANRDSCELNYIDWQETLIRAAARLTDSGLRPIFMNLPLCVLPQVLWQHAAHSISDWKRVYVAECENCAMRQSCCGLFASNSRGWRPGPIVAFKGESVDE